MNADRLIELRDPYRAGLLNDVLPFWIRQGRNVISVPERKSLEKSLPPTAHAMEVLATLQRSFT